MTVVAIATITDQEVIVVRDFMNDPSGANMKIRAYLHRTAKLPILNRLIYMRLRGGNSSGISIISFSITC